MHTPIYLSQMKNIRTSQYSTDLPPEDQKELRTGRRSVLAALLGRLASAKCKPKKDAQFGGVAVFLREDECHSPRSPER